MPSSHEENAEPVGYLAKWIFPVGQAAIENGIVICEQGKIREVGSRGDHSCSTVFDFGEQAIVPGLVNANTHLEFSDLAQPLGNPTAGFTNWILDVIAYRKANDTAPTAALSDSSKDLAIESGITESATAGVVAIGEIATNPWSFEAYQSAFESFAMRGVVFHEQLGNNPLEAFAKSNAISAAVNRFDVRNWTAAISPHAPYSTALTLFQTLVAAASQSKTRVAIHLAETIEEIEFIETGAGPFSEMLKQLDIPFKRPSGVINVGDYLKTLAQTEALIVHGNYLNVEELEFIAQHDNLNVVFCPRTHAYFGHDEYPLRTMLDLKINVAVGTDSRASNPDLDLFEELKQIASTQNAVSAREILRMGTQSGARALGLEKLLGTIEPEMSSQLCVVSHPDGIQSVQDLFEPDSVCQPIKAKLQEL